MHILKKNTYIFLEANWDPIKPDYVLHIYLGNLENEFEPFSHPEIQFGTSCTFLRKISTFFTKIYTFFWRTSGPIKLNVLNIHLRGLGNEFELFSYPEMQFGTLCTFLKKICTYTLKKKYALLKKKYVHSL